MMEQVKSQDLFDQLGLSVTTGDVATDIEVGETYPIFGMVTDIVEVGEERIIIKINYNITAQVNVGNPKQLELLKERAFESGIFISKVVSKEPSVHVKCETIIFGKQQAHRV